MKLREILSVTALLAIWAVPAGAVVVPVPAYPEWSTDTGVYLTVGTPFTVQAWGSWTSGLWTGGPDGQNPPPGGGFIMTDKPAYGLIGKIGQNGMPFWVGSAFSGTADEGGNLILGMNDTPGMFGDNSGSLTAEIVPEPLSLIALGTGAVGVVGSALRRRRNSNASA